MVRLGGRDNLVQERQGRADGVGQGEGGLAGELCRLWILELGQEADFVDAELVVAAACNDRGVTRLVAFALAPVRGPEHELEVANLFSSTKTNLKKLNHTSVVMFSSLHHHLRRQPCPLWGYPPPPLPPYV